MDEQPWQRWVRERLHEHAERIDIHLHIDGPINIHTDGAGVLQQILHNTEELIMSGTTLSEQLDAATAAIQADVAAVSAEVTKLLAGVTPGSTITQAQIDALIAIDASLKAIPPAP